MSKSINGNVIGLCEENGFCPWEYFKLNEDSFVVDLGAFHGDFSKYILDTYNCRVDAYEPSLNAFDLTHPKFTFINKPVFDGSQVNFNVNQSSTSGSIFRGGDPIDSVDIRTITKEKIDLMKVNIEGAEMVVLKLADLNNVAQIIVEFHLFTIKEKYREKLAVEIEDLVKHIMSFGYKSHRMNDAPAYFFSKT